jgi:hypothetical protein
VGRRDPGAVSGTCHARAGARRSARELRAARERGYDERFPDATTSGDHDTLTVYVTNTSRQPVYDLAISWYLGDAPWEAGTKDEESVLMPDSQWGATRNLPPLLPLTAAGRRYSAPRGSAMPLASAG